MRARAEQTREREWQQPPRARRLRALRVLLLLPGLGCAVPEPATRGLVPAAIAARGGPLPAFERSARLDVHYGFPGRWRWTLAFRRPDHLHLTLHTSGEAQRLVSDGGRVRTFLGTALLDETHDDDPCLPAMARWVALVNLDALLAPPFAWQEIAPEALPAGAVRGVRAHCTARPAEAYTLLFDAALRLVAAEGPVRIPVLGDGWLAARFADFRRVDGRLLPFRIDYRLHGQRFFEEHVQHAHVGAPEPALNGETGGRPGAGAGSR